MFYYSLQHRSPETGFREATLKGQAPDKGLYFPSLLPRLNPAFLTHIRQYSREALGLEVMLPYVGDSIPKDILAAIIGESIGFEFPLRQLSDRIYSLELFHGPTLAFKDVGARFMSRCLGYFNDNEQEKTTVLVATSGDTGGAVAHGFQGVEGVEVIILYPRGKVSRIQELQLTTCGGNITALQVDGSFDDCQSMVKQAFTDPDLQRQYNLTSANSINVARWLPQQLYYLMAWQQWEDARPPVISVPSGNFGNICAGILAHLRGMPVQHFIAACNSNDTIPQFLQTGQYQPKPAKATLSNAMDVGDPSNFVRILELFHQQFADLKRVLSSTTVTDALTRSTIREVFEKYHYTLDPHGAVGFHSLQEYLRNHPDDQGIFLETAHPVKFPEVVEAVTGTPVEIPSHLASLMHKKMEFIPLENHYAALREWLRNR